MFDFESFTLVLGVDGGVASVVDKNCARGESNCKKEVRRCEASYVAMFGIFSKQFLYNFS